MEIKTVAFTPFEGQKPGTAGLRKPTREFVQPHYTEAFIQAVLNTFKAQGQPLNEFFIGGDGRYPGAAILPQIIRILIANGVEKISVAGKDMVATAPAISFMMIKNKIPVGFAFSASHNPGGENGDFGIKIEIDGGQPTETFTNPLYQETLVNSEYYLADLSDEEALAHPFVQYLDPVADYADLMEKMFDFDLVRKWFKDGNRFRFDGMFASSGKYAREIFVNRLGAAQDSLVRCESLEDFGGLHPEPNPTYNKELYDFMMSGGADFGAACDGDGDRNMVLGAGAFVYPSDSLAVMVKYRNLVPYYAKRFNGVARSLPTSSAVDKVAEREGVDCYQTPTGWKYFVSLLEAGRISLCGEESFGQGGDYCREKDGIFPVLFWLTILASTGKNVAEVLGELWGEYGRTFYSQYSYEGVDKTAADSLWKWACGADLTGQKFGAHTITSYENFDYTDPVSGAASVGQGVQLFTDMGARIFFRLSGTGTVGATLRFYIEKYEKDSARFGEAGQKYLGDIYALVEDIFRLKEYFGEGIIPSAVN